MCMNGLYYECLHIMYVHCMCAWCLWRPQGTGTPGTELQTLVSHPEGARTYPQIPAGAEGLVFLTAESSLQPA